MFTIHPAAIPAGAEVLFSFEKSQANPPYRGPVIGGTVAVIWDDSHLACPPGLPGVRHGAKPTAG